MRTMKKKIIPCLLVVSLSFYIGCYSTEMVTKDELKTQVEQVDITVFTKDSVEYKFVKGNYRVQGDSLVGFGVQKMGYIDVPFHGSIALADITSIETGGFSVGKTVLLGVGLIVVVGAGAFLISMYTVTRLH
jgi:hypothetical protein